MLQHEVLGRINDYDFALNISVCLVLEKSTSNQQGSTSLSPTHHTNAYKKYQLQCTQRMTNSYKEREYTITTESMRGIEMI
jgi:nitrate reductase cytochrome c-type subunit